MLIVTKYMYQEKNFLTWTSSKEITILLSNLTLHLVKVILLSHIFCKLTPSHSGLKIHMS